LGIVVTAQVIKLSDRRKPRVDPMMLPVAFIVAWLAVSAAMVDLVRESFAGDHQ
jgi:hypothetical protein